MTTLRIASSFFLCATLVPVLAHAQYEPSGTPTYPDPALNGSSSTLPQDEQAQNQRLANDEKKDSGRVLELVWANAEAGFGYVNLQSLNNKNLEIQNSASSGGMFGVGAGIRLAIFTLGVRARLNELSSFNLWETNGEFGFHIPIKKWDPYLSLHGGYTFVGTLDSSALSSAASSAASDFSVHGADAGLSLGVDYYFIPFVSLGLDLSAEALFLSRPALVTLPAAATNNLSAADQAALKASGDAAGIGASGSLHLGLHI
jgi:hypothetical protein